MYCTSPDYKVLLLIVLAARIVTAVLSQKELVVFSCSFLRLAVRCKSNLLVLRDAADVETTGPC